MGAPDPAVTRASALPVRIPAELAGYADEPPQMRSGAVGKSGYLHLDFERRGERTVLAGLASRTPYLAQRALHCDDGLPDMAWVFTITTGGCVLQGDRMSLAVRVRTGARAHVTTQSATKVHAMDANFALLEQAFRLDAGAYLEYLPDPLIPHRRARLASDTTIAIDESASLLLSEILQPGRKHHHPDECFGATVLSLATRATRPDGAPLFEERLVIEPATQALRYAGAMGEFDVLANVILLTPPGVARTVSDRIEAHVDRAAGLASGACALPNDAGLVFRVLGCETEGVRRKVREFWAVAREAITGAALAPPFVWR
jgi:urease accessory protein